MSKKTQTTNEATATATPNEAPKEEFKIDKNVDIPAPDTSARGKYPWAQMDVNDSFFVAGKTANNMTQSARKWAKSHKPDAKFTARKLVEGGVEGVRIWRTA